MPIWLIIQNLKFSFSFLTQSYYPGNYVSEFKHLFDALTSYSLFGWKDTTGSDVFFYLLKFLWTEPIYIFCLCLSFFPCPSLSGLPEGHAGEESLHGDDGGLSQAQSCRRGCTFQYEWRGSTAEQCWVHKEYLYCKREYSSISTLLQWLNYIFKNVLEW